MLTSYQRFQQERYGNILPEQDMFSLPGDPKPPAQGDPGDEQPDPFDKWMDDQAFFSLTEQAF